MAWDSRERRRFPRVALLCSIAVSSPSQVLVSHTENIGEGGVRVRLKERLNPPTMVTLKIPMRKERTTECKGVVVWVAEKANTIKRHLLLKEQPRLFDTGIKFTKIDDSDRQYIREVVNIILAQEKK